MELIMILRYNMTVLLKNVMTESQACLEELDFDLITIHVFQIQMR